MDCGFSASNSSNTEIHSIAHSKWIADCAATSHMTNEKELINPQTLKHLRGIEVADGSIIQASLIGEAHINLQRGKFILRSVLYSPFLNCNLFSIRQILKEGGTVRFYDFDKCCITYQGKILIIPSTRNDQWYIEDGQLITEKGFAAKSDKLELWHRRMGHTNFDNIYKTIKNKVARIGEELLDTDKPPPPFNCETCITSKDFKRSFKTRLPKTNAPLEIVHGDTMDINHNQMASQKEQIVPS